MIKLSINTELVTPHGSFDYDESTAKLLGSSPYLDDLSLFIREVTQNSWDARIKTKPVNDINFEIELGAFNKSQSNIFKETIFNGDAYANMLVEKLVSATKEGNPFIIVRDSGTVGLEGPTEANLAREGKNNFISFVRNIGQSRHDPNDGGTYGFGKAVFFKYSDARTFITYTRTHDENGKLVSRIIGMTLDKENMPPNVICTGRHWWGVKPATDVNYNQPLSGDNADLLATQIGFKKYKPEQTGTSVLIISPKFPFDNTSIHLSSPEGRNTVANAIGETLNAWYWPRIMGSGDRNGKIIPSIICDGKILEVSAATEMSPLNLYATAFEEIQGIINNPEHITNPLVSLKEIKNIRSGDVYGYLAIFKAHIIERPAYSAKLLKERHPLSGLMWGADARPATSSHVALVRNQGQIIRYLETTPSTRPSQEYGAVFYLHPKGRNAAEINLEIRKSEQAAHDDWSTTASPRAAFIIRKITELIENFVAPVDVNQINGFGRTGRVSLMLAVLWGDGDGPGGIDPPITPPKPTTGSSNSKKIKSEFKLGFYNNKKCIFVEALIPKDLKADDSIEASISTRNEISGSDDETSQRAIGWFNNLLSQTTPSKDNQISSTSKLVLTKDIIGKKVTLIVLNAEKHGLSVDLILNAKN